MFEYVFWDNDGVLVDTEELYFQANVETFRLCGYHLSRESYVKHFLEEGSGVWHLLGLSEQQACQLRARRSERYAELLQAECTATTGASDALKCLRPHFCMAIVTTSSKEHFALAHRRTGLLGYVDFVVAAGDYARPKPFPDPYLAALRIAGTKPAQALAVEDSQRGVRSAKSAGLTCWAIPTTLTRGSDFSEADKVLGSIAEACSLLMRAVGRLHADT